MISLIEGSTGGEMTHIGLETVLADQSGVAITEQTKTKFTLTRKFHEAWADFALNLWRR